MRTLLLAIIAIGILLLAGTAAIESSVSASGDRFDIDNETWSPDPGNETELDHSNIEPAQYDSRVAVRDEDGGKMIAGSDYRWNDDNGTVTALEGGRLAANTSAAIDYGYSVPSDEQEDLLALWTSVTQVGPGILIFAMAVLIVLAMARFAEGA